MSFVQRSGATLTLDGHPYHFVGYNMPYQMWDGESLSTALGDWGAGQTVARIFCFQTYNIVSGAINWTALDALLATFAAHGDRVILVLGNNINGAGGPNDDGALKDLVWWQGGSPNGYDVKVQSTSSPAQVLTYRAWVSAIVTRYASNQTVLMWQLMNEAQAINANGTGTEAAANTAMVAFANDVGALVKGIDSNHLLSLGNIVGYNGGAGGQQWTGSQTYYDPPASGYNTQTGGDYYLLGAVSYLDVLDYHDYGYLQAMGLPYTVPGLQVALDIGASLGKPVIVGELGLDWTASPQYGQPAMSPSTLAERAKLFSQKIAAQIPAGVAGICVWTWRNNPQVSDGGDYGSEVGPSDPALATLATGIGAGHLSFAGSGTAALPTPATGVGCLTMLGAGAAAIAVAAIGAGHLALAGHALASGANPAMQAFWYEGKWWLAPAPFPPGTVPWLAARDATHEGGH